MSERHPSEELAQWLQEVGQRRNPRPQSEPSRKAERTRSKRQYFKNALLAALLIMAVLQYYFIDVQLQILSQPSLTVFVRTIDLGVQSRVRM
jgi:type VI protein secretion system component VasF